MKEMTDEQILECIKAVYDFLCDVSGKDSKKVDFGDDPLSQKMTETLTKYEYNMVDFCQFVNDKYNFYENPLWVKTGQEFFSDDFSQPGPSNAKLMLKSLLRDQKLNEILC
jgi:hypothetical protein